MAENRDMDEQDAKVRRMLIKAGRGKFEDMILNSCSYSNMLYSNDNGEPCTYGEWIETVNFESRDNRSYEILVPRSISVNKFIETFDSALRELYDEKLEEYTKKGN